MSQDLDRVRRAAERATESRARLIEAIVKASKNGASRREVARAAGLSGGRIQQILDEQATTKADRSRN